jgi:hypothetical protein
VHVSLFRGRLLPLLLTALLAALAAPGLGQDKKEGKKDRKYALVVGVSLYKKDELRALKYAEKDAAALASALKAAGYRRVVLLSHAAAAKDADLLPTARNLKAQLKGLLEDRRKDDTVVVAFFGHGAQFAGSKEHYLCPIDAELDEPETLVPLSEVYRELARCKAGHKLVVLDACHARPGSGGGGGARLEALARPQELEVPRGVLALFGCSAGQSSLESDRLGQGLLPHYLLKGLSGPAAGKGGPVTLEGLVSYLRAEVPAAAQEEGARQTPLLRGEAAGPLVLLPRPVALGPIVVKPKGPQPQQTGKLSARVLNEEGTVKFATPYAVKPTVTISNRYFRVVEVTPTHFRWQHVDNTPSTADWTARVLPPHLMEQTGALSAKVRNEEGSVKFAPPFGAPPTVTLSNRFFMVVEVTATQFRWKHLDDTPSKAVWTAVGAREKGKR